MDAWCVRSSSNHRLIPSDSAERKAMLAKLEARLIWPKVSRYRATNISTWICCRSV